MKKKRKKEEKYIKGEDRRKDKYSAVTVESLKRWRIDLLSQKVIKPYL